MNENIDDLFLQFAAMQDTIESIRAELPQLGEAEKTAEEIKAKIQAYAKENGETSAYGWEVKLSNRKVWDTKKLEHDHPELRVYQNETLVASVKRAKNTERGQAAGELLIAAFVLFVVIGCPVIGAAMFWGANGY